MSNHISEITDFLTWLYGEEALLHGHNGIVYPVTVKRCYAINPEDILLDVISDNRQFPNSSRLLEEMKQKQLHLWNGPTYVFRKLGQVSHLPQLQCSVGHYFDTINTCMVLAEELKPNIATGTDVNFDSLYRAMPLRRTLHAGRTGKAALEDVWTGNNRSAAISISCLFVVCDRVSYYYYAHRRSSKLADDAGLYHVIPSMVFQPITEHVQSPYDFNITNTILRELAEELFERDEFTDTDIEAEHSGAYPEIVALQELLRAGSAELVVTGVAVDLLTLRPEILAVLVVHASDWLGRFQQDIQFCSEFRDAADPPSKIHEQESRFYLDDDSILQPGCEFGLENSVVTGAACLILGLPVARQLRDRYRQMNDAIKQ